MIKYAIIDLTKHMLASEFIMKINGAYYWYWHTKETWEPYTTYVGSEHFNYEDNRHLTEEEFMEEFGVEMMLGELEK